MAQTAPSFCSILAQEQGFDPIGTASPYEDLILIELPLLWAYRIWDSAHLPEEFTEFVLAASKAREYKLRVLFVAPEADYCQPDALRVIYFQRPVGLAKRFAQYQVVTLEHFSEVSPAYNFEVGELPTVALQLEGT